MPVVEAFNLTPVKSTALIHPDEIHLRPEGAVGDRRFLFVHPRGERLSGLSKAPLFKIRSTYDVEEEHLRLVFPEQGLDVSGDSTAVGDQVTVKLYDREVRARRVDPRFTEAAREATSQSTRGGSTACPSCLEPRSTTSGCAAGSSSSTRGGSGC
jgi:uncharacterized protein YcbX